MSTSVVRLHVAPIWTGTGPLEREALEDLGSRQRVERLAHEAPAPLRRGTGSLAAVAITSSSGPSWTSRKWM